MTESGKSYADESNLHSDERPSHSRVIFFKWTFALDLSGAKIAKITLICGRNHVFSFVASILSIACIESFKFSLFINKVDFELYGENNFPIVNEAS